MFELGCYPFLFFKECSLHLVFIKEKITICDVVILHLSILVTRFHVAAWWPRIRVVLVVLVQAILRFSSLCHLVKSHFKIVIVALSYRIAIILPL